MCVWVRACVQVRVWVDAWVYVVRSCGASAYATTNGSARQDQQCLEQNDLAASITGVPVQDSKWLNGCVCVCV